MGFKTVSRILPWLLPPTEKHILTLLAHYRDDDRGTCYPSVVRLARESGLHRVTVINALARLEEAGAITVTRTPGRPSQYGIPESWTGSAGLPVAQGYQSSTATEPVVVDYKTGSRGLPDQELSKSNRESPQPLPEHLEPLRRQGSKIGINGTVSEWLEVTKNLTSAEVAEVSQGTSLVGWPSVFRKLRAEWEVRRETAKRAFQAEANNAAVAGRIRNVLEQFQKDGVVPPYKDLVGLPEYQVLKRMPPKAIEGALQAALAGGAGLHSQDSKGWAEAI